MVRDVLKSHVETVGMRPKRLASQTMNLPLALGRMEVALHMEILDALGSPIQTYAKGKCYGTSWSPYRKSIGIRP